MITKIEIKNFQSHKNTILEFDKGINVITGESDNGKSAVIRAIRWVVENQPSGIEKINSSWNEDFKEPLSVKLYTENGYVERIRTKTRNGYTIDGKELSAIGRSVPKEVLDFLNVSDVNFQFQMDSPYLLSMSPGQASQYLNQIVHLDSIDNILSFSDSDKRQLSSEQKVVENDIKKLENEIKNLIWVEEANTFSKRIDKLNEFIEQLGNNYDILNLSIFEFEKCQQQSELNLSENLKLLDYIENIDIPDFIPLQKEIKDYENCENKIIDLSKHQKLIDDIDSIILTDYVSLQTEIKDYENQFNIINKIQFELNDLKKLIPNICPLCGNEIKAGSLCL